jgi:hypothetical protein
MERNMPIFSTEHARSFFESIGFAVEDIPEAEAEGQKRADLRVTIGEEEYVVEAKFRSPHREWYEVLQRAEAGEFATTTREVEPWRTLSDVIQKARAQLVATPASTSAFRILWVVAPHSDDSFVIPCIEKQLLGVRQLFVYQAEDFSKNFGASPTLRQCYYFEDNDFERYPEIDAAMLFAQDGGQLFVNHFSPNRDRFRRSRLYEVVSGKGAVIDADVLRRDGKALMLDTDFGGPRGAGAQQTYLRVKHDILVNVVHESHWKGVAVVPVRTTSSAAENEAEHFAAEEGDGAVSATEEKANGEHDGG